LFNGYRQFDISLREVETQYTVSNAVGGAYGNDEQSAGGKKTRQVDGFFE
jgi:hypothetical protein